MTETIYVYDGTFEGLLTTIFEIYESKRLPEAIQPHDRKSPQLFAEVTDVFTDVKKANRVAKKLEAIDKSLFKNLFRVYLSEHNERELLIYRIVRLMLEDSSRAKSDFRHPDILRMKQILKEISREVHRMHAFVRFQRLADDIWFSAVEPDFDVMPLIGSHFRKRYADQKWLIYDLRRGYGIYYDLQKTDFVELDAKNLGSLSEDLLHDEEKDYQALWKEYFDSVNIKARRNMKLHIRHVPKRYWKHLFEKL
jgi:probable DNA metabolism protein